jgi:aldehyde:ferredoxin oxidoreductase
MRAFNAREGFDRRSEVLPRKMYQALQGGASDGIALNEQEFESAKDVYYELAGWDLESGNPSSARLRELGLAWVADLMETG